MWGRGRWCCRAHCARWIVVKFERRHLSAAARTAPARRCRVRCAAPRRNRECRAPRDAGGHWPSPVAPLLLLPPWPWHPQRPSRRRRSTPSPAAPQRVPSVLHRGGIRTPAVYPRRPTRSPDTITEYPDCAAPTALRAPAGAPPTPSAATPPARASPASPTRMPGGARCQCVVEGVSRGVGAADGDSAGGAAVAVDRWGRCGAVGGGAGGGTGGGGDGAGVGCVGGAAPNGIGWDVGVGGAVRRAATGVDAARAGRCPPRPRCRFGRCPGRLHSPRPRATPPSSTHPMYPWWSGTFPRWPLPATAALARQPPPPSMQSFPATTPQRLCSSRPFHTVGGPRTVQSSARPALDRAVPRSAVFGTLVACSFTRVRSSNNNTPSERPPGLAPPHRSVGRMERRGGGWEARRRQAWGQSKRGMV
eukprot:ctg_1348.g489